MMADTHSLEQNAGGKRPLSPHLQIYRPMLTMMMSIVHRITGFGNYFGTLLLAWWFIAAASPNGYARFQWFAGSWIGRLILFGYTWSVIHHMLGGIRHLIWDTGRGHYAIPIVSMMNSHSTIVIAIEPIRPAAANHSRSFGPKPRPVSQIRWRMPPSM